MASPQKKPVKKLKKKPAQLWSITIESESSDHYGPFLFDRKPTSKELENFMRDKFSAEFTEDDSGPGIFGSYLHITFSGPVVVEKLGAK